MLKLLAVLAVLLFAQPVFAQEEKVPDLPDYTKRELIEWHVDPVLYKGNDAYMLNEHYAMNDGKGLILVFYKPLPKNKYVILAAIDQQDLEKQIRILADKEPLFGYYLESKYGKYAYIYEKTSKWYKVYRLWQPRWELAGKFVNPGASESYEDLERVEKFIEQRYGLKKW